VTHVSGQKRQLVQEGSSFLIPLVKPVDGKRMAQVMQARAASPGRRAERAAVTDQVEVAMQGRSRELGSGVFVDGKDGVGGSQTWAEPPAIAHVGTEHRFGVGREGDQAFFVKLGFPEGDRAFVKIDVLDFEPECFVHPETAGIEKVKDGFHGASHGIGEFGGFLEELADFHERIDIGLFVANGQERDGSGGIIFEETSSHEVLAEASKKLDAAVFDVIGDHRLAINPVEHQAFVELRDIGNSQLPQRTVEIPGDIPHTVGIAGKSACHFKFEVVAQEAGAGVAIETEFTEGDWHRCRPLRRDHGY